MNIDGYSKKQLLERAARTKAAKQSGLPYTMAQCGLLLGQKVENKCECGQAVGEDGKWCDCCREELEDRANSEVEDDYEARREGHIAEKAKEKYYHDKYGEV